MAPRKVLIAGASIAGPTLAYWLDRYGMEPTVVERAPELRLGGQNVDVRGAGRVVAARTGIEDAVRAAGTVNGVWNSSTPPAPRRPRSP